MHVAVLRGDEHTDLGPAPTLPCGLRCAVGLTRGRHPKPYTHLDPNEDFAACAEGDAGALLAVADGHNGIEAADTAIRHVLTALGSPALRPGRPAEELISLLSDAGQAAWEATRAHPYPRRGSRTALGVVLAEGARAQWAVVGDVAVIAGGPEGVSVLNTLNEVFLGGPTEPHHVADISDIGTVLLQSGEWLVLASDGLLNFAPLRQVGDVLAAGSDPEHVAAALLALACDNGAGDNVAVAVLAPAVALPHQA